MMRYFLNDNGHTIFQVNLSALTLTLPTLGVTIWFKSGEKPDNLYGEDVFAVVIDEASRLREEAWHAVRTVVTATRAPIRMIGNVKGRRNWFYQMARRAELCDGEYGVHKMTAYDAIEAGVLAEAEIESARAELPEHVFRELYLAEPSDDEGNPFGIREIDACVAPMSTATPRYWGWDLARKQDWTVGIALDRGGYVCKFERFRKPWDLTFELIVDRTRHTSARVDATGVGDVIVEGLVKKCKQLEGYVFTGPSKQILMEGLALAIHKKTVRFPEGVIAQELRHAHRHEPSACSSQHLLPLIEPPQHLPRHRPGPITAEPEPLPLGLGHLPEIEGFAPETCPETRHVFAFAPVLHPVRVRKYCVRCCKSFFAHFVFLFLGYYYLLRTRFFLTHRPGCGCLLGGARLAAAVPCGLAHAEGTPRLGLVERGGLGWSARLAPLA